MICQNFVSFPVQTALGVQLGFRIQWIVYILKFEEDLTSFEFMSLFEISQMYLVFDSVNNSEGSQNTDWLKYGTFQGYNHMAELLVKIAYAVF